MEAAKRPLGHPGEGTDGLRGVSRWGLADRTHTMSQDVGERGTGRCPELWWELGWEGMLGGVWPGPESYPGFVIDGVESPG